MNTSIILIVIIIIIVVVVVIIIVVVIVVVVVIIIIIVVVVAGVMFIQVLNVNGYLILSVEIVSDHSDSLLAFVSRCCAEAERVISESRDFMLGCYHEVIGLILSNCDPIVLLLILGLDLLTSKPLLSWK